MSKVLVLLSPLLLTLLCSCGSLPAPRGTSLNSWEEDPGRMRTLEQEGVGETSRHVVAWFPRQGLSNGQRTAIVRRLDLGVGAAKRFIGKPDWEFQGDRRIYFYFPDERFVAHAPGGNVAYIPFRRIQEDQAPWLHEAMHLLLATPEGDWLAKPAELANERMPLWLEEGLAESLAMEIATQEGFAHYSPLIAVPASELDALCVKLLREAPSDRILARIGGRGKLPELFGPDREAYAPAFYAASTSFVRYISARYGYGPLLEAIAAFDNEIEELEKQTGSSLEQIKADWLKEIGYSQPPGSLEGDGE